MAAEARILALLLVYILPFAITQSGQATRCSYMTDIPREDKPDDLPAIEWSGGWSQWPLIPVVPESDDVCMDTYIPPQGSNLAQYVIYMDEEIVDPVPIAKLNYEGTATPTIEVPLLSGSANMLGPEIRKENDEWFLYITQRQDYETPGMQLYMFYVGVAGENTRALVSLQIVNIDDNDPIIQMFGACQVPELGEPRLTDCIYQVSDADGEISTRFMTFEVSSERNDEEIFYMKGTNIPEDWYIMNMTVGIYSPLDFDTNALHVFQVTAFDSIPNTHTVTMMVQVENVEHRSPRWVEIFAVQQFDEKTLQNFTVKAIDGDTGIDKPIYYRLERDPSDTFFSIETIEGGRDGAIFYVDKIDRDALQKELFQLSIIAYKADNDSYATEANIAIIVNDINDQIPKPHIEEYHISILEETALTLNFLEDFGFHDIDLGPHAQYKVELESEYPPGVHEAFYIAPEVGYQNQNFIMGTLNHSMLDYEVEEFQNIRIRVVATDMDKPEFVGVSHLYIDLINWNDELPIFEEEVVTVSFNETEGAGYFVGTVRAHDRDIGDRVVHSLMGNAADYLRIDQDTGDIFVAIDNAFDYHRQNELFIQVRADDTLMEPYHITTAQLIIQLKDINNTPPTLRLPRGSNQVQENVPENHEITKEIEATDPDTTALLQFEIDWDTSYATKQGREADPLEFHGCVDIETIYPDPTNQGDAIGRIVAKEIRHNVTIDYEEFEVLYLAVRVRDLNTELGEDYDEATFTLTIIDMNDNPPLWAEDTLTQPFRVRELSVEDIVIGSVLATDIDGPLYNQVRYTIFPTGDTPEELIKIDFVTGQIAVNTSYAIDADTPLRWNLTYTIIASDECSTPDPADCPPDPTFWETPGDITIEIIDTNNKIPYADLERFEPIVYIYENASTGDDIIFLYSIDNDRDEMYNTVGYQINYAVNDRLRDFFAVDRETGRVYVEYTTVDVLDRDGDEPEHRIFFTLIDNFNSEGDGNRNQNETEVLVVLLDVNDNAPELPEPHDLSWSVSENLGAGIRLQPDIYAPDRDEPNTDNSRVGYAIMGLDVTNRDIVVPELFNMIQIANVTGELETAMDLRGYWGTYDIHIQAYDHGEPQMSSDEVYELVIRPYNFYAPVFVFPQDGTVVRLSREKAMVNGLLAMVNDDYLGQITATDDDGLEAGIVTFSVTGDEDGMNYFTAVTDGENAGILLLSQMFPEQTREFRVTIRATDGGTEPNSLFTETTIELVYVPTQADPIFSTDTADVAFVEKEVGLLEKFQLPLASDAKNYRCDGDCHDIYYKIIDGNNAGHFAVDSLTNEIYLVTELDRNDNEFHQLTVAASNSLESSQPLTGGTLTVHITVREAHPRPYFGKSLYTAGITATDIINRELLTIHATHSEGASVTYSIDHDSMVVNPTLEAVRDSAFILNKVTGLLTLNIQPTAAMEGMFEFYVVATDPAGETDRAEVKVYVVSKQNQVYFIFYNTVTDIEENRDFIADELSAGFEMTCNVDQIVPATDTTSGVASSTETELRAHFILEDLPVSVEAIDELRSDTQRLMALRATLSTRGVNLENLLTNSDQAMTNTAQVTVYVLGGLAAVLAVLCVLLMLTFFIRTRALNKRLEALTMTKYGSVDSGLNRVGIIAPGTNKHAVEGSNPIWNEAIKAPDFDSLSDASGDSDLIGIEDMPQFRSDYFPTEENDIATDGQPVAHHNNAFGFQNSPSNNHFSNMRL